MYTLSKPHTLMEEIKKSRFTAIAVHIKNTEDALKQRESISDPEATHNCWAYKAGDQYRFSDDGEPGGTAGRPILAAIDGCGLDHVLVVVIRFFGGIKLGAGGLARAYGGTASKCLAAASKVEIKKKIEVIIDAPFNAIGSVYSALDQFAVGKPDEAYQETGIVLTLKIDEDSYIAFEKAVKDATRGRAGVVKRMG
ncbi:MAG: YigZ family protein [Proteobacteria bacterium]|nr:YigZ family protein [Pseudomonadota bacterium]